MTGASLAQVAKTGRAGNRWDADAGELVEVLPHLVTIPKPVALLLSDRKYRFPKVRAFMGWLTDIFS